MYMCIFIYKITRVSKHNKEEKWMRKGKVFELYYLLLSLAIFLSLVILHLENISFSF